MKGDFVRYTNPGVNRRLVLLHGWGADADDLIPFGHQLIENKKNIVELISLRAPEQHPQGLGRQWYGLFPPDWAAVPEAVKGLQMRLALLDKSEIPLRRTVLMGFSQGGAMALSAGCNLPFAGLICCSAYPHPDWKPPVNRPPLVLFHGKQDDVVPLTASEKIIQLLKNTKQEKILYEFDGGHCIPGEVIPRMQYAMNTWLS